jgi:hypothetical protein
MKKLIAWLNEPVSPAIFDDTKSVRRWHVWHPGSGLFGGMFLGIFVATPIMYHFFIK